MFAAIAAVVSWIWNGIQAVADWVITGLVFAFHALRAFGLAVWDGAKWTYQNILKPVGSFLHRAYDRLKSFYETVYSKVHGWLGRISKSLRDIYDLFFRPILNTIDAVRKVLQLLSLLHVTWAADLDAALGALERKLSLPLQLAIEWVNRIQNRIESYILTVDNLFQRVTFLKTAFRDAGHVLNMNWHLMLRNVPTPKHLRKGQKVEPQPVTDHIATLEEILTTDGFPDASGMAIALASLDEALRA